MISATWGSSTALQSNSKVRYTLHCTQEALKFPQHVAEEPLLHEWFEFSVAIQYIERIVMQSRAFHYASDKESKDQRNCTELATETLTDD